MALIWAASAVDGQVFARSVAGPELRGAAVSDGGLAPTTRVDGTNRAGTDIRARILVAQARPNQPRPEGEAPRSGVFPVRMSAVLKGISKL